ncbi:hypothetical protein ACWD4L_36065 [Streptomyces sp. NPDC002596]
MVELDVVDVGELHEEPVRTTAVVVEVLLLEACLTRNGIWAPTDLGMGRVAVFAAALSRLSPMMPTGHSSR